LIPGTGGINKLVGVQMILNQKRVIKFLIDKSVLIALILLFLVMSILKSSFLTYNNMINILTQISIYGVVASAMTMAIIAGEFDLSVSSIFAFSSIMFISLSGTIGIGPAILLVLLIGMAIGLFNGLLVSKAKINAFIVTLGTMVTFKGVSLFYTDGKPVRTTEEIIYKMGNGRILNIPYLIILFFIILIITEIILKKTIFGRNLYATGGNMKVARVAGIHVDFYKTIIFVILGLLSSVAGIMLACRLSAGSALYGGDLALSVVAAVVIGGTSLSGGKGSALKTLVGLLVVGVLYNSLSLLKIQAYYQEVVKGSILIIIVSLDALYKNKND
jgi:ribose/xylose/arabinose/galactoside ABC-type transport system permease subunit